MNVPKSMKIYVSKVGMFSKVDPMWNAVSNQAFKHGLEVVSLSGQVVVKAEDGAFYYYTKPPKATDWDSKWMKNKCAMNPISFEIYLRGGPIKDKDE